MGFKHVQASCTAVAGERRLRKEANNSTTTLLGLNHDHEAMQPLSRMPLDDFVPWWSLFVILVAKVVGTEEMRTALGLQAGRLDGGPLAWSILYLGAIHAFLSCSSAGFGHVTTEYLYISSYITSYIIYPRMVETSTSLLGIQQEHCTKCLLLFLPSLTFFVYA